MRCRFCLVILFLLLGAGATAAQGDPIIATIYQTVNVRSGPDARYEIVGQLHDGDTVEVIGRESEASRWLQVTLPDGSEGWVPVFMLTLEATLEEIPVTAVDEPADEGTDSGVSIIAYGRVNVRSGPSILYEIVDQLDVGDTARVTARSNETNDWLYIENDMMSGWVAYFTVRVTGDPDSLPVRVPDAGGNTLVAPSALVTARFNVRLHEDAALESPVSGLVPFNSQVMPVARSANGDWLYVTFGDLAGWGATDLFVVSAAQLEQISVYDEVMAESTAEATLAPGAPTPAPAQPASLVNETMAITAEATAAE